MQFDPVDGLITDPGLQDAKLLLERLNKNGILVYFNPRLGVMLIGNQVHGVMQVPTRKDMDDASALCNEIEALFAMQSLSKQYDAATHSQSILQRVSQVTNNAAR